MICCNLATAEDMMSFMTPESVPASCFLQSVSSFVSCFVEKDWMSPMDFSRAWNSLSDHMETYPGQGCGFSKAHGMRRRKHRDAMAADLRAK